MLINNQLKEMGEVKLRLYDVKQDYEVIQKVGCGTYGTVFKAYNKKTKDFVAIKKIQNKDPKLQGDGFPITALRQAALLKCMKHPNVVKLREIIVSKPSKRNLFRGSTFLVFDYLAHDFAGLFKNKITFPLTQIKCLMKQILEGVAYLHRENILHRDLKSANLLLSAGGKVKIADFGLSRRCKPDPRYTPKVVTLWYRAPELLLGVRGYSSKIDMWSVGCIFVEFFIRDVLFKKDREYEQIERMLDVCGGVEENGLFDKNMPQAERERMYQGYKKQVRPRPEQLAETLRNYNMGIDAFTIQFLKPFLQLNPEKRISAEDALKHQYFTTEPLPCEAHQISQFASEYHELITKKIPEKPVQKDADFKYPLPKGFENEKAPFKESSRYSKEQYQSSEFRQRNNHSKDYRRDEQFRDRQSSKAESKDYDRKKDYRDDRQQREIDRNRNQDGSREVRGENRYKDKGQRERDRSPKEREKDKDRQREKEREKERERLRQRQRERETDKQRDRNRDYQRGSISQKYQTTRQKDGKYRDYRDDRKQGQYQKDNSRGYNKGNQGRQYSRDDVKDPNKDKDSRDQRRPERTFQNKPKDSQARQYRDYRQRRESKDRDYRQSKQQTSDRYYQRDDRRPDTHRRGGPSDQKYSRRQQDGYQPRRDKRRSNSYDHGYSKERSRSNDKYEGSSRYNNHR